MSSTHHTSGRILPHQRDYDNLPNILVADKLPSADYETNLEITLCNQLTDKTLKDYRRRITRIIKYWKENHPEYYEIAHVKVDINDLIHPTKYYYNYYKSDVVYLGFNVKYLIDFLLHEKVRSDGKILSYDNIRKCKDAILWGSRVRNTKLPLDFYTEMDTFLAACKREVAKGKKEGLTSENA